MKRRQLHPLIPEIVNDYQKGKMSRREFLRFSALLGVSTYTAAQLGGFMLPRTALGATAKRGGEIKVSAKLQKITHPAQLHMVEGDQHFLYPVTVEI